MNHFSIDKLRQETPGCKHVLHFNNAGAALPTKVVLDAVKQHLDLEATIGGYEAQTANLSLSEKFYDVAAELIHCQRDEIAFTENATRAWDMAFYSFKFKKGDRIVTARAEYASNYLAFLHMAKHCGVEIAVVPDDEYGQLDLAQMEQMIDERVKLIAITHVPTQGGLINPAIEVGNIAKQFHIPYLLDTTQSIGQMPIDVNEIACDFLCATGRKYLRGPRGTGFLFMRKSFLEKCDPPFVDLHAAKWIQDNDYQLRPDAKRFETWEQNIAAKIGLTVAIEYALKLGVDVIWERIQMLAIKFRQQLSTIPNLTLRDLGKNKCGIITFTHEHKDALAIQRYLTQHKINVSVSLQEYARLDLVKRKLPSLVRASVHYYNNEEEIDRFCEVMKGI